MVFGYAILLVLGIFMARFGQKRVWIKIHRIMQSIALFLVTVGIFLGFWSAHGIPHLAHAIIGTAAYIFAILQPISAYLNYRSQQIDYFIDEDEKLKANNSFQKRFRNNFWRLFHHFSGFISIILAFINISLGIFYAVYHYLWYVIWFTYFGFIIVMFGLFELKKRCWKLKRNDRKSKNTSNITDNDDDDESESEKTSKLKIDKMNKKFSQFDKNDDEQFRLEPLNTTTNSSNQQRYTPNKSIIKNSSPSQPPHTYYPNNNNNNNRTDSLKSKNSIQSKQSKLIEYSQTMKKLPQSHSRQLLVENYNSDDGDYEQQQQQRQLRRYDQQNSPIKVNTNIIQNQHNLTKVLQYSPKFKSSYEHYNSNY